MYRPSRNMSGLRWQQDAVSRAVETGKMMKMLKISKMSKKIIITTEIRILLQTLIMIKMKKILITLLLLLLTLREREGLVRERAMTYISCPLASGKGAAGQQPLFIALKAGY